MSIPGVSVQTLLLLPQQSMKLAASDNRAPPVPTSSSFPGGINPERLTGQGRITEQGDSMQLCPEGMRHEGCKTSRLEKSACGVARRLAVITHAMLRVGTLFEA